MLVQHESGIKTRGAPRPVLGTQHTEVLPPPYSQYHVRYPDDDLTTLSYDDVIMRQSFLEEAADKSLTDEAAAGYQSRCHDNGDEAMGQFFGRQQNQILLREAMR